MFENIPMLAGLGGAAAPLVIHLLGRARYRTVDWGAMMFLGGNAPRWREGAKLRETALLLVRMAAVGLLAVALARPVAGEAGTAGAGVAENRVAAAIVVDCSASMSYEDVGGSRMDRARTAVLQILSTLKRGDRACLILAGAAGTGAATPQFSGDLQALAARVSELKPTPGSADLAEALTTAGALLDRQDRASRQLYLVCDRQAVSWKNVTEAFASAWTKAHAALGRFIVVPVGGAETDNVSIESVTLLNPPAVRGCTAQVKVRVKNHGPESRVGLPLTLKLDDRDVFTSTTSMGADGVDSVLATVHFDAAGPAVLSAELKGGGPNLDDRGYCVVDVSGPIRVLIVRGGNRGDARGSDRVSATHVPLRADDADLLRVALAPYTASGKDGADLASVETVAAGDWDVARLPGYQIVVLDEVPAPSEAQAAALEQFVYSGGGLLIAPGPGARTEEYNRLMYREEGGLLPALLQPVLAPPAPAGIDGSTIEASHAMLRFMSGHSGAMAAEVERYLPITARTPASHVLASYTSGDAMLVESPYGRGRVVLVTCSLGTTWSTLPLTDFYLPLVQSAARYLAGANVPERNVAVGMELVALFDPPVTVRRGAVIRPDGSHDTCGITTADRRSEARYARTDLPGVYTIRVGTGEAERVAKFSVAAPASESDLAALPDAEWKRLEKSLNFTRMEPADRPLAVRLAGARGQGEYWLTALAGVVGLLVIELAMTRSWSGEGEGGKVRR